MRRPKGLPEPVTVQLTLAPESAPYYALENEPLIVTTPAHGKTNTITAQVRATGKSKISADRDRNLSPPLIFRADIKDSEAETLAYTTRAKLVRPRTQSSDKSTAAASSN